MNEGKTNCQNRLSRRDLLKYGIFAGLMLGMPGSLLVTGCTKRKNKKPNVLLITLDTTRIDHLGCYGYHRDTTPNLDTLASESVIYTQAYSTSSWTLPSHASLFTGKFTSSHGAQYDPNGPLSLTDAIKGSPSWKQYLARGLAANEVTLPLVLKQAGYATGAVVAGPWLKKVFGLQKGFDYYDDNQITKANGRLASDVTLQASQWIEKVKDKSFFLFLNYFDPHWPLKPTEPFIKKFLPSYLKMPNKGITSNPELLVGLYDAEILYMDFHVGRFLEKLKVLGLYDNTWVIITADHGELLGEHGKFNHGVSLYQEEIHIPLFMKFPYGEEKHRQIDTKVQLLDIFPTVCNRTALDIPPGIQGSILPYVKHPIIAETYPLLYASKDGAWRTMIEGDNKFLWNSKGQHLLFNLKDDPHESTNLAGREERQVEKMTINLNQYLAGLPKPGPMSQGKKVDKATKDALKSLGYIQ